VSQAWSFRHAASFGKRIEYWIIGRMLKEGLDVYVPLVDDQGVDAIVLRPNQTVATVQIKARSSVCQAGNAGLFAAIDHPAPRPDHWFVFYAERMDTTWLLSSREFLQASSANKSGKNKGLRTLSLNGRKKDRASGRVVEFCRPQFARFVVSSFERLAGGTLTMR